MSRTLLLTNSGYDIATSYLDCWHEKLVEVARKRADTCVLELRGEDFNRENFTRIIEREQPHFIIFNGHGSEDSLHGHNRELLIKVDDNEYLFNNRIVHTLACKSGVVLGPRLIDIGAIAYIGYIKDWEMWNQGKDTPEGRRNDWLANLFLEPAFAAVISIIEGSTVEEAFKWSQQVYSKNLALLIQDPSNSVYAASLFSNLRSQICLGEAGAIF